VEGVDLILAHTQGRGIWAIDRGGNRKKLLGPLLDRANASSSAPPVNAVIDRRPLQGSCGRGGWALTAALSNAHH
jgi:hypothetical protein